MLKANIKGPTNQIILQDIQGVFELMIRTVRSDNTCQGKKFLYGKAGNNPFIQLKIQNISNQAEHGLSFITVRIAQIF